LLGEILRHKREEAGLDLREVAHSLRFQYEYLKALEAEDLKKLPPDVYVKAYIRGYAKLLNIDPLPLLDDYAELGRDHSVEAQQPEPPQPKKHVPLPRKAVFVSLLILAGLVLVIVMYFTYPTPPVVVPVLPSVPVPEKGTPVPDGGEPLKDLKQHVLDVTATETTWLLIETGEGMSEEVLLRPGESRKWTSESGFDLKVGNAGGIRMVLDNKDVGTPGEKGRVVRLHLP
jgi:transcriptional regulator with XRE-family HTH domain